MVFEKIKEILAEQLDADPEEMTMDTKIAEDLEADSLDVVELLTVSYTHLSRRPGMKMFICLCLYPKACCRRRRIMLRALPPRLHG